MLTRLSLPPRAVLAIDGHGASGKTTLARQLATEHGAACVVGTDDLAWHHSFFDWADLLIDAILFPYRAGHAVSYRPPGWVTMGRAGSIEVPADTQLLIVEGTGAGRLEAAEYVDALIWVDVDLDVARERGLARDVASGVNGTREEAERFWDEWMAEEIPFLNQHRPWDRADLIVGR